MSEQENRRLVEQTYASFKAGDIPAVLQSMSEKIKWQLPKVENVPFSGKRQGRNAVAEFFSLLAGLQEARSFELHEFIAAGDKVVALGHYVWQVKANGRTLDADFAHVFTVQGGEIVAFDEYTDTAAAAKAFRPG
ncbi:MAG TPA: nuclear transport factor 2 family protein [Bradyrhizobium sp.]|nr:nuclear transport factor 2 family protein [Bradyrhizobium sp.]